MRRLGIALATLLVTHVSAVAGGDAPVIRRVAAAGQAAPGGGTFEHFSVEWLPVVAPVNDRGQIAFFATLLRSAASEGVFLASGSAITKVAVDGDPAPGGGTLSGFGKHPVPALNVRTRHLCQVPWRWRFDHGQGTDLRHSTTNALGLTLPRHSCCGQIRSSR